MWDSRIAKRSAVLLVTASVGAACFSPAPSTPPADPPADPAVDAGVDASPIVPGGDDDIDRDNVKNAADNCPAISNADQHDEDGDRHGDVCDNCPHAANPTQANIEEIAAGAQSDAVGDACDPRSKLAGDTIVTFYPFHVAPQGITQTNTWSLGGDGYRFTGVDGTRGELTLAGDHDRITIEIAGDTGEARTRRRIAIKASGTSFGYYDCGYFDCRASSCDGPFYDAASMGYRYSDGKWDDFDWRSSPQEVNGLFTIRFTSDSTQESLSCTTIDARDSFTTTAIDDPDPGTIGVFVDSAPVTLRYLIVFGRI